jgi:flagellar export protein FliJ
MPFHFPLQMVLHFRQSVEHQQELRLLAANQQVLRVRSLIEHLDKRQSAAITHQSQELDSGTNGAELYFSSLCEAALRVQRQNMERELLRLEGVCAEQKKIFQQARQERETFESLHDQQLRQYTRAATRRQQRQLDDLFLARQAYLKRS